MTQSNTNITQVITGGTIIGWDRLVLSCILPLFYFFNVLNSLTISYIRLLSMYSLVISLSVFIRIIIIRIVITKCRLVIIDINRYRLIRIRIIFHFSHNRPHNISNILFDNLIHCIDRVRFNFTDNRKR